MRFLATAFMFTMLLAGIVSPAVAVTNTSQFVNQQGQPQLDSEGYRDASKQIDDFGRRVFNTRNAPRSPIEIAASIIKTALGVLGFVTVVVIFYAGYQWITSAGSDEKIKAAKGRIVNAVIGLLIIMLAYGIASFVINSLSTATGQ